MAIKNKNLIPRVIFIALASLILLEALLFLTGRYVLSQRRMKKIPDGEVRLVCVGDSHTFGVGTSMQYSYPMQLEKLLALNNPGQRFSVVNLGAPGLSSRRQIQALANFFDTADAQIVFLLTGRNNYFEVMHRKNQAFSRKFFWGIFNFSRSFRFLTYVFKRDKENASRPSSEYSRSLSEYLNPLLQEAQGLCQRNGAQLVLVSYYNSLDAVVKEFAQRHNLVYFDFVRDFESLFKSQGRDKYLSFDRSHLNYQGYKFFAEELYGELFLNKTRLGLKIKPLIKMIPDDIFYTDPDQTEKNIQRQKERIGKSRGSREYPFELVHLGHIYTETKDMAAAKKYYLEALIASGYEDNNTLVSPIINWYLKNGQDKEALGVCEEILTHNPKNGIARFYRDWLLRDA